MAPYVTHKNPKIAVLLASTLGIFGLLGIGHIYVGRWVQGVLILITGLILDGLMVMTFFSMTFFPGRDPTTNVIDMGADVFLFIGIVYFAVFIWQIFDSRSLAKKFNNDK
jgi:hypothetical protein